MKLPSDSRPNWAMCLSFQMSMSKAPKVQASTPAERRSEVNQHDEFGSGAAGQQAGSFFRSKVESR